MLKIFLVMLIAVPANSQYQYGTSEYYVGFGSSIASYIGGYFGQAYQLRAFTVYDDYYYDYYNDYDYYYEDYTLWSPLVADFNLGKNINENVAFEISSAFVYHYNGRVDPQITSGSINGRDYIDRNDYSVLFAIPVSALIKLQTSSGTDNGAFIKAGPAFQYTSEKYDRVREYYSYSYESRSYYGYLGTFEKAEWLPGFTVNIGINYALFPEVSVVTELGYSYFSISGQTHRSALALDNAPEAQMISFKTLINFDF